MKYNRETIKKIIDALHEGQGRVRACKIAGIYYSTFMDWMTKKPEFYKRVKKAEEKGENKIKDLAQRGIIEKFQDQWQAAAWWLERKYPEEFRNRQEIEQNNSKLPDLSNLTFEELYELKHGKKPGQDDRTE